MKSKIMEFIKHNFFGFLLGAVIFTFVGVSAAGILAGDVSYVTSPNSITGATNVEDALDELYDRIDSNYKYIYAYESAYYVTEHSVGKYTASQFSSSLQTIKRSPNYHGLFVRLDRLWDADIDDFIIPSMCIEDENNQIECYSIGDETVNEDAFSFEDDGRSLYATKTYYASSELIEYNGKMVPAEFNYVRCTADYLYSTKMISCLVAECANNTCSYQHP